MPIRFTCRLCAVKTESGKFRVLYQPLTEPKIAHFLELAGGPNLILPPPDDLTADEYHQWVDGLRAQGWVQADKVMREGPLVVAKRTYEDVIPAGAVATQFYWTALPEGRTLVAEFANGSRQMIPQFSAQIVCRKEVPGLSEVVALLAFGTAKETSQGIQPGCSVRHFLPVARLSDMRSVSAPISPENLYISLGTDGYEFDRVPGAWLADFLMSEPG